MSWEDLINEDPDVIIVCPIGNGIDAIRREMEVPIKQGGWRDLDAVKEKKTYIIDGKQFCHRPGPRLIESLEIFAEILHPETFYFGHQKRAWEIF